MRCACATHRAQYDHKYTARVLRGWPRWLAFLVCPPASRSFEESAAYLDEYARAATEQRIGVGILGSVICPDTTTASRITESFGLRGVSR